MQRLGKKITYFGILRSITSWAKVSREMINALLSLGAEVNIYERKGFLYDRKFPLNYNIKARITNKFAGNIVFTFEHPRTYRYLPKNYFKIGMLVYEFTVLPRFWVEQINQKLDWVIVPSRFCQKVFRSCGVKQNKIKVLRYGFNPRYYYPKDCPLSGHTDYTFLCIANPHKREGIELLLESFSRAFTREDRAKLILKLTYLPGKMAKTFEYADLSGLFQAYLKKKHAGRIQIIDRPLTEGQTANLYRVSHCYVSLSRAEAFGLGFLEALACAVPVISISWGGQTDFLNGQNTYFVKHTLVPAKEEVYEKQEPAGLIALPDVGHAAEIMCGLYAHRQVKTEKGYSLKPYPAYFWWSTIAQEFLQLLNTLDI